MGSTGGFTNLSPGTSPPNAELTLAHTVQTSSNGWKTSCRVGGWRVEGGDWTCIRGGLDSLTGNKADIQCKRVCCVLERGMRVWNIIL